jgi:hypothetical protein
MGDFRGRSRSTTGDPALASDHTEPLALAGLSHRWATWFPSRDRIVSQAPIANPPALRGGDITNFSFQCLDATQNLAETAVELANGHVMGHVRLEQEETDFPRVARTSFAKPLHEQPYQVDVLGRKPKVDLLGVRHGSPFGLQSPDILIC